MARLNVTYAGFNGDLVDPVVFDLSDQELRTLAQEALQAGSVQGIPAQTDADLSYFVVERYSEPVELGDRVLIRPKVPFGGQ